MKQLLTLSSILFALVFVGASCQQTNTPSMNAATDTAVTQEDSIENDEMIAQDEVGEDKMEDDEIEKDSMVKDEDVESMNEESEMVAPDSTAQKGAYVDYNASQIAAAAASGDAVLFFHAPWCPTCAALNADIESNASEIPDGLTIFKTDFDSELELRKQYGVTYQHTLVQVDASGNMITKWSGGNTLDSVVSKVR